VSTTATAYCTASPLPICVHFSQLSTRLHASSPVSASSTTSLTLRDDPALATSPPTHPIQVVFTGQQVPAPSYLADKCIPVLATYGRTHLRSAVHCDLVVPRTRLAGYGPRGFSVSGPVTWNSLPPDLRDTSPSAASFFSHLKTELFIRAYYMTS